MFIKTSQDISLNEKELQDKYVKYGPIYVKNNPTKHIFLSFSLPSLPSVYFGNVHIKLIPVIT